MAFRFGPCLRDRLSVHVVMADRNFVGNPTYQDLMRRTNNCASLFALHWLTRPNYGNPWLEH